MIKKIICKIKGHKHARVYDDYTGTFGWMCFRCGEIMWECKTIIAKGVSKIQFNNNFAKVEEIEREYKEENDRI